MAVDRRMEQSDTAVSAQLEKLHHILKKEEIINLIKEDVIVECHETAAGILGQFEKQCVEDLEYILFTWTKIIFCEAFSVFHSTFHRN